MTPLLRIALVVSCGLVGSVPAAEDVRSVLTADQWQRVESSVDRGLQYLASRQQPDGTFPTTPAAQPAITSLCIMAFLSRGHQPGVGPYGKQLDRAIDLVLSCQASDGMFSLRPLQGHHVDKGASHTGVYNHAISSLMLTEAFGVTDPVRAERIRPAIAKALEFARRLQLRPTKMPAERGGWRYFHRLNNHTPSDSDLSVTGWHLMFYRSAKNAEFDIPKQYIDDAMAFVDQCYLPNEGAFIYGINGKWDGRHTRGMVGCGILSLAMGGRHDSEPAKQAGNWLLRNPFDRYGETVGYRDRFFYSAYYCSQGMFQLGGDYWRGFYPPLVKTLLGAQQANGAWPPEPKKGDRVFGDCYTTALSVLSLTPPFQLIPIYQR